MTTEQLDIWNADRLETAGDQGIEGARRGDPDGFARCVRAIRRKGHLNVSFTSDDVHRDPEIVLPGNELGSAFRFLHQQGEIEATGFEISNRPESHRRPIRVWTATSELRDWAVDDR